MFPCKDSTLNNSLGNAIFPSQRLVTTSAARVLLAIEYDLRVALMDVGNGS